MIGEHVVRLALAALDYLVLHGDRDLDEDIVLRLGLHHHIQLAHLQRNLIADAVYPRHLKVQSSMCHLLEFAQTLQYGSFASANDEIAIEERSQDNQQDKDYYYGGNH